MGNSINQRIREVVDKSIYKSVNAFAKANNIPQTTLNDCISKGKEPKASLINKIHNASPLINLTWLLTGEGSMLKDSEGNSEASKKLVPFYDDVVSIGGINKSTANIDGQIYPSEWIDAGDWFRDATAAIRHYGDSMIEYPAGCILALKEVKDRNLILWGKDYVIETSEYRVTKRIQKGESDEYIRACSTNADTYPDGSLIHEPINIPLKSILHIFLVLGHVVNQYSSRMAGIGN
jgi:hypothetical protein